MVELLQGLIARHIYLSTINSLDEVKVLDTAAGTGIAGAALAPGLHDWVKRYGLL